jgi:1-aminocyclopropane-1-carboxylate deaminase/D-cysteine desulfhydrase-like pyridoxal-dependent ACC family enzyme
MDFSDILYKATPVEKRGSLWFKRDDLFEFAGMRGAKVRAALNLCIRAKSQGYSAVVSACSRHSPQMAILGAVGKELGLRVSGFVAEGSLTPILRKAVSLGVSLHPVRAGYSVVVQSRARQWAVDNGAFLVPFGMADRESSSLSASQVKTITPLKDISRIILVAGSGVNMVGLIHGMVSEGINVPVLGVLVGHDCRSFVLENCNGSKVQASFVKSSISYEKDSMFSRVNGVDVDSRYEGKLVPFLLPGDLFWVIGFATSSLVSLARDL